MSPASYRKPWEQGVIWHLKEYWFLYAFIFQTIYTFWFNNFTIQNHTDRIAQLETRQNNEDVLLSEIKSRLASIDTSVEFIKQIVQK